MSATHTKELDFLQILIPTVVGILVILTLLLYFFRRKNFEKVKVSVEPPPPVLATTQPSLNDNFTGQNLMNT